MALFRRRGKRGGATVRDLRGDAAAVRAALLALNTELALTSSGHAIDLRALVRDLLEGEIEAPTADIMELGRRGTDPDEFYEQEIAPSWERLDREQRGARIEGFIELSSMVDSANGEGGLPEEMKPVVHTKTLLLAWAFDETYGYLSRLARGEPEPARD